MQSNGLLFAAIAVVAIAVLASLLLTGDGRFVSAMAVDNSHVTKSGWRQAGRCAAKLEGTAGDADTAAVGLMARCPNTASKGSVWAGAGNTLRATRPMAGMVRKSLETRPPAGVLHGSGAAPKRTGRLSLDQRRYGEGRAQSST